MPKRKTPSLPALDRVNQWRRYDDNHHRSFHCMPSPESLHPGASTVERAADGDLCAQAIALAYLRTRALLPPDNKRMPYEVVDVEVAHG